MVTASISESDGRARGKVKCSLPSDDSEQSERGSHVGFRQRQARGTCMGDPQAEAPRKPCQASRVPRPPRGAPRSQPRGQMGFPWVETGSPRSPALPARVPTLLPRELRTLALPGADPTHRDSRTEVGWSPREGLRRGPGSQTQPRGQGGWDGSPFLKNCPRTREQGPPQRHSDQAPTPAAPPAPVLGKGNNSGRLVRTRTPNSPQSQSRPRCQRDL